MHICAGRLTEHFLEPGMAHPTRFHAVEHGDLQGACVWSRNGRRTDGHAAPTMFAGVDVIGPSAGPTRPKWARAEKQAAITPTAAAPKENTGPPQWRTSACTSSTERGRPTFTELSHS